MMGRCSFSTARWPSLCPCPSRPSTRSCALPSAPRSRPNYGKQFFVRADLNARIQGEAIVADRVRESELENEYKKTVAACQVEFQGETCNFYGLLKHMESPDRSVRRAAFLAWASQYEGVSAKLDEIYDQLLALRVAWRKSWAWRATRRWPTSAKGAPNTPRARSRRSGNRFGTSSCPRWPAGARRRRRASAWTSCATMTKASSSPRATPTPSATRRFSWRRRRRCTMRSAPKRANSSVSCASISSLT